MSGFPASLIEGLIHEPAAPSPEQAENQGLVNRLRNLTNEYRTPLVIGVTLGLCVWYFNKKLRSTNKSISQVRPFFCQSKPENFVFQIIVFVDWSV